MVLYAVVVAFILFLLKKGRGRGFIGIKAILLWYMPILMGQKAKRLLEIEQRSNARKVFMSGYGTEVVLLL